ncbi:MAG: hypothetical protein AB7G87_00505 [Clostridia bacterium]
MTIKPIDFQISIPKTSEVSKIQNENNQRSNIHHQQASFAMQQQAEQDLKKVNAADKPFEGKIREKEKEEQKSKNKKKFQHKRQDESSENDKPKEVRADLDKGSVIDIQI